MENEAVCRWRVGAHHGGCDVPALAAQDEAWGVVSQHGSFGTSRLIFCDGDFSADPVRCYGVYGTSGVVALP